MRVILIVLLMAASALAFAQEGSAGHPANNHDECSLNLDALQPLLDTKAASVRKVLSSRKDLQNRRFTESLLLKDGTTVTYSIGGCAHYGYYFRYDAAGPIPAHEGEVIDRALKLVGKTPVIKRENATDPIKIFVDALQKAKASKARFTDKILPLECGDAVCEIEVKDKSLWVKYDFAL